MGAKEAEELLTLPGTRGWIVSGTYSLGEKVFRVLDRDFISYRDLLPRVVKRHYSSQMYLELVNGSIVEVKSADHPDSLQGEGLDWLIFDECASCKALVWEQFLRPTLTDREGIALFITTPKCYNWVYDIYQRGATDDGTWGVHRSPSSENPTLSKGDLAQAKTELSSVIYEQEYEASFKTFAGAVYPDFDILSHCMDMERVIKAEWKHFRCIDFGYTNPFVCLWVAVDPFDRIYVYDELYIRNHTIEQCAEIINARPKRHIGEFELSVCDPSEAGGRATLLGKGIPTAIPTGKSREVVTGIELVRQALKFRADGKPGLYVDKDKCPNMVAEFQAYKYPDPKADRNEAELPNKEFDHAMDAIRYLLSAWNRAKVVQLR